VRRRGLLLGVVALLAMALQPVPVRAQYLTTDHILFLPTYARAPHEALAAEVHDRLRAGIVVPPGKRLIERERVAELIEGRRLSDLVGDVTELGDLAGSTGVAFVVATVLRERRDGGFEISGISFSREEREILNCVTMVFASAADLRAGLGEMARELSKATNYSSSDSALFLSLVIPGLGQVLKERPLHGLMSFGLFGGALTYALTIPRADQFVFDRDKFTNQYDWSTGENDYFVFGSNVGAEAFFAELDGDWDHHLRASAQRRLEAIRRKRATGLVVAAYLFNLVDVLVLTRTPLDTRSFFLGLEAIPDTGSGPDCDMLRLRLRVRFR